jgi:hypothetical protein
VRTYAAAAPHKAVAVEMGGGHFFWVWNRLSREEAVDSALEACQITIGRPCVLVAVDDRVLAAPATGSWTPRDMPRARYSGNFDPAEIPAVYQAVRARDDVVGYRLAHAPKAAAFHPVHVRLFIVANAANQHAAEVQALAACNSDPVRAGVGGSCFLYATGNRVVLPLRLREPMTAE